jgi:hypothetical protein
MRPEAIAVAGYYPLPERLTPAIAKLVDVERAENVSYLDPVAGEGAALHDIIEAHRGLANERSFCLAQHVYAVELESTRFAEMRQVLDRFTRENGAPWMRGPRYLLHGDALRVSWNRDSHGATVLYLNPPYDHDREFGRLEERFLRRFVEALAPGGALIFVVPFYALTASADTLSRWFEWVVCYRFPLPEFDMFSQVVLVGRRRTTCLDRPEPELADRIRRWGENRSLLAELPSSPPAAVDLEPQELNPAGHLYGWELLPINARAILERTSAWSFTDRTGARHPIPGVSPIPGEANLVRTYPVAMPPRPAHIAAGIAAGVFNGAPIRPDDPSSDLPPILLKGVFDREFRTVDTKQNKDGEVTGEIQVQQPRLVTTALDLRTRRYSTIVPKVERTAATSLDEMTMADLLHHYGKGLMRLMVERCPVLYDPTSDAARAPLPTLERPLYEAQAHAARAAVALLGGSDVDMRQRRGKRAFVLGEVGTGKSSIAIAVSEAVRARRTLVMCPPHLLRSWQEQVRMVAPHIRTVVLDDVRDVDALACSDDGPAIAVLSRETAKLGHGIEGVGRCPACGAASSDPTENARRRSRCATVRRTPVDGYGSLAIDAAIEVARLFPEREDARQLASSFVDPRVIDAWKRSAETLSRPEKLTAILRLMRAASRSAVLLKALAGLAVAYPHEPTVLAIARSLYTATERAEERRSTARRLLIILPPSNALERTIVELSQRYPSRHGARTWERLRADREIVWLERKHTPTDLGWGDEAIVRAKDGRLLLGHATVDDRTGLVGAVARVLDLKTQLSEPCGEPLFQAIPSPRRYPIATYIARRHRRLFDMLVLDESHELSNDESAQSRAGHRLMALGMPTLFLTGTVMNGYAESLFANMWAASPAFREEFARDEKQKFVDRYGYRKQLVEHRDEKTKKVVAYGAHSDRVEVSTRPLGNAPGVLPLFVLKHLLPLAVTIHKSDLAVGVPPCTESVVKVTPTPEMRSTFRELETKLRSEIRKTMFSADLAGKLWGAMAELPSYFDLSSNDVGNRADGRFVLAYPESVGGDVVAAADGAPHVALLPKEQALLEHLRAAFSEGRNVMVLAWHVRLLPRLARIIKRELGEIAPVLAPEKVPTAKREAWIDETVVRPGRRVMLANPVTVQTGLNNLVHFADEWWHENPGCNPTIYRQTVGRVDRIGQRLATRIVFPVYEETMQEIAHKLLLHKVGVSQSVDGLDAESALSAAGVGEQDELSSFAIGRQLYELIQEAS